MRDRKLSGLQNTAGNCPKDREQNVGWNRREGKMRGRRKGRNSHRWEFM